MSVHDDVEIFVFNKRNNKNRAQEPIYSRVQERDKDDMINFLTSKCAENNHD